MIPIKFAFIISVAFAFFYFSPQIDSVLMVEKQEKDADAVKKVSVEQKSDPGQQDTSDEDASEQKQSEQKQKKTTWRDNPNDCDMSEQYVAKSDFSCIDKPDPEPQPTQESSPQTAQQPTQTSPTSLSERERITYDFYTNRGLTHTSTAYLMGTIKQESGFKPNGSCGDRGLACGLFQWHPNRRVGMPNTFRGQLQWSMQELKGSYPDILNTFKTSNNTSQIKNALYGWIRYGHTGNRYYYAQQYLSKF